MKRLNSIILLTLLMSMVGAKAYAQDIAVENADGVTIYYNYINDGKELEVASNSYNSYSGSVVIPEEVTYMNRTRKVTSIGGYAFYDCRGLTSVTIPNSVNSIGRFAFYCCSSLTSITIPNSVMTISNNTFEGCTDLTSVHISDLESWCKIIFHETASNPLVFAHHLFLNGVEIKDLVIPNSVTSIGASAFCSCSDLGSVTIGNSVKSIGNLAFYAADIPTIITLIDNPFDISGSTFSKNTFVNATLYVPVGSIDKYKLTEGWKDFAYIEEGSGPNGSGETPATQKCEKPTISYSNGKLTFSSATEGATFQSSISDADIKSYSSSEVQLGVTYYISVYTTKAGYENSETVTATLCWIDVDPKTEGIDNGVAQVRANAVLIQSRGNVLNITGAPDGSVISVYNLAGEKVGSAKVTSESADVSTSLQFGDVGIVKIGEKSIKVLMK